MQSVPARTLVILKPEVIERGITGKVLQYFDREGLKSIAMYQRTGSEYKFRSHYKDVIDRNGSAVGDDIIARMTRGPCIFIVYVAGDNINTTLTHFKGGGVIELARIIIGATDPAKASTGTIRRDLSTSLQYNVVHASDSRESAEREIGIWFPELVGPANIEQHNSSIYFNGC